MCRRPKHDAFRITAAFIVSRERLPVGRGTADSMVGLADELQIVKFRS
jgi:hypothetical protein